MRIWGKETVMDLIYRVFSLFDGVRIWRPLLKNWKVRIGVPSIVVNAVLAVQRNGGRWSRGPTSMIPRSDL
jgi:hypothetical protein